MKSEFVNLCIEFTYFSYFQTIRGRQLNAYELDQLRLLQKM